MAPSTMAGSTAYRDNSGTAAIKAAVTVRRAAGKSIALAPCSAGVSGHREPGIRSNSR